MKKFLRILALVLASASMAPAANFGVKYIQTETAPQGTPFLVKGNLYSMHDGGTISVIDSRSNELSAVIPILENIRIGGCPYETSVVGQYIYVFGLSISVIDSNTNTIIKKIPISSNYPYDLTDLVSYKPSKIVQSNYLYVFRLKDDHSFTVYKIDTNIHEIIDTIELTNEYENLKHPDLILSTNKEGHFAILHKCGRLTMVDLNSRHFGKTFLTRFESIASKENLIYIFNQEEGVSVIDSNNSDKILTTIALNKKIGYYKKAAVMIIISEHLYILEHLSNDPQHSSDWRYDCRYDRCIVSVIDIKSSETVKTFDLNVYHNHFIAIRDKLFLDSPGEIVVIDTRSLEVTKRIQKPRGVYGWFAAAGEHISMTDKHNISIIDTNTDQIAATFFRDAPPVRPLVNGRFMYAPEIGSIAIYDLADFLLEYKHQKL